ncbi:hypothetical protein SAMN05444920_106226 [Nonomuraea solani]|uniref:Uncharacterized protein n=1 Tax=Nonomuraea solani TaxID=1144553 RepID=A0A1H6DSX2_9ACTN|nr:hypothetical protein [Nonomuraea solani]SEG88349.1 hypothetical protein SAMN05444920_106226 [Nonomuraea solani]
MRRLLPVLALCALAGCGSPAPAPPAAAPSNTPATSTPAATPTPAPTPTSTPSPSRKPTTKVKDCYDADCLLKLSRPVTIRLNAKKFYYPKFEIVAVSAKTITYVVEYPHGGGAQQVLGKGGSSGFGFRDRPTVEVTLVSIRKGQALLSISPRKDG